MENFHNNETTLFHLLINVFFVRSARTMNWNVKIKTTSQAFSIGLHSDLPSMKFDDRFGNYKKTRVNALIIIKLFKNIEGGDLRHNPSPEPFPP